MIQTDCVLEWLTYGTFCNSLILRVAAQDLTGIFSSSFWLIVDLTLYGGSRFPCVYLGKCSSSFCIGIYGLVWNTLLPFTDSFLLWTSLLSFSQSRRGGLLVVDQLGTGSFFFCVLIKILEDNIMDRVCFPFTFAWFC